MTTGLQEGKRSGAHQQEGRRPGVVDQLHQETPRHPSDPATQSPIPSYLCI
jgi:hypothetical protein